MYKIEVHEKIIQIFEFYVLLGWWKNGDSKNGKLKIIFLIIYFTLPISWVHAGIFGSDKNQFGFLTSMGIGVLILAFKLSYILWKQTEIRQLTFGICFHTVTDFDESVKIGLQMKKLIAFSCAFLTMTGVCTVIAIIFYLPILSSEKMLPFNILCPVSCKNNAITFWISYVYVSIGALISAVLTSFNAITWYLMSNCAIKYQIVAGQFRNLTKTKPEAKKEEEHWEELINLMKTHNNLRKTINRFKYCFENLFFIQIFTSGIGICGSVYALAFILDEDTIIQLVINGALLVHSLFDIFMVMYFGNEIMLSSDQLSYSLFESDWIVRSEAYKKCLIIVTEMVKQPHNLVIAKLYPLNLDTFTSILNLVYSMLNVLKNLK